MAQAARLSLRMQKEVKLLAEDPPHGTSFTSLSDLSSIDALIEGPEGTVYAGGVFKIRVQIPERYPFQPPNVTFATPIYHPNIDTGGRICLDILNLPPKGGWQPSLNVSTVLTSIRLLLSEPNPDDGLMCEASKEFKYDRQAFDRKARFMTEKYARFGLSCGSFDGHSNSHGHSMQPDSSLISIGGDELCKKSIDKLKDDETASTKLGGIRRKLSLASSSTMVNKHDGVSETSPAVSFLENPTDKNLTRGDQQAWKYECVYDEPHEMQSNISSGSSKELTEDFDQAEPNVLSRKNPIDGLSSGSIKKLSVANKRRLSLGVKGQLKTLQEENKENIDPNVQSKRSLIDQKAIEKHGQVSSLNACELFGEEAGESRSPDAVIVLDSEDSEEEADNSSVARKFVGQKRIALLRLKTRRMN